MTTPGPRDSIDARALSLALESTAGTSDRIVGRRIECFTRIGSTNDRARELASSGEPEGTVVLAEEQTRGRGRGGRIWHSPRGLGLYLSILLRPSASAAEAPVAGLMTAVAACRALEDFTRGAVRIKWPNDILVDTAGDPARPRKVAGILTESRTVSDGIRDVVVGIGVNVNHEERDFPPDVAERATSLRLCATGAVDREEVAVALLDQMERWYRLWNERGSAAVVEAFRGRALDAEGRRVRVFEGDESWTGMTAGVTDGGALLVKPDSAAADGTRAPLEIRFGEVLRLEEV